MVCLPQQQLEPLFELQSALSLHLVYQASPRLIQRSETKELVGATPVSPAPLKRRPVDLPTLSPDLSTQTPSLRSVPPESIPTAANYLASYQFQCRMPVTEHDQPAEEERSLPYTNFVGLGLVLCASTVAPSSSPATSEPTSRLRKLAPPPLVFKPLSSPVLGVLSPQLTPASSVLGEFPVISTPRRQPDVLTGIFSPISTTPTYLVFPGDARDTSVTVPDIPPRQSSISCGADLLGVPLSARSVEGTTHEGTNNVPLASSSSRPAVVLDESSPMLSPIHRREPAIDENTIEHLEPPPLLRTNFLTLSPLTGASNWSAQLLSPLQVDFRRLVSVDDLILRAENCAEIMEHVKLVRMSLTFMRFSFA